LEFAGDSFAAAGPPGAFLEPGRRGELAATEDGAAETRPTTARGALTAREWQVAELAVQGVKTAAIALNVGIAEGTVKAHLKHIFAKVGVRNRLELAAYIRAPISERGAEVMWRYAAKWGKRPRIDAAQ
jgi:DNA-binding NarL/FixJ family response regulator